MRDRTIERLKAEFGVPTDIEQGRWTTPRGQHCPLNVVVDNAPNRPPGTARVWIFDPHSKCSDSITSLEIVNAEQIDALIHGLKSRMQSGSMDWRTCEAGSPSMKPR